MSVFDKIDEIVSTADSNVPQKTRRRKIHLYAEGLKSKIRQSEYSLSSLESLSVRTDAAVTTTTHDEYGITDQVGFYCDTFWAFLYSGLDVLAQIINQSLNLGMREKEVSFKQVVNHLNTKNSGTPLQQKCDACLKSNAFKNLDAYRNCSTHRRQIYIKEEVKIVKHTAGYHTTTTGPVDSLVRIICDNPLDMTPQVRQRREIPQFLDYTKEKILNHIETILKNIIPIK